MVDYCAESDEMKLEHIFSPKPGECINVTSDRNIYQVCGHLFKTCCMACPKCAFSLFRSN